MKLVKSTKVYDWIFWISIGVIVVWMILKAAGIIQSPQWQELLPFAGAVAAIAAYFQKSGAFFQRVDHIADDLHTFKSETKAELREISGRLKQHDEKFIRIETKLSG